MAMVMIKRRLFSTSMRTPTMKVDDYLERIKYQGPLKPSLQTLRGLVWAHKTTVPFTNLDFVNGKRIGLEVHEMYDKIVTNNCGGVCLEINGLFCWLLEELGFNVTLYIANFYIESEKKWSVWGGHCIPCVKCKDEEARQLSKYLVDPGYQLTGPMKFDLMKPYVDRHGIYRIRKCPGENDHHILELHKKSVYNNRGELLKQGLALDRQADGNCDDECRREDSRHWNPLHMFREAALDVLSLRDMVDKHQDNKEVVANNLILLRYHNNGYNSIFGKKYFIKQCPNAVTDIITEEQEVSTNEDVAVMARDVFGCEIKDKLNIFDT